MKKLNMKKIALIIVSVFTTGSYAQKSFEKKTNVISVGGDLGLYAYVSKIASSPKSEKDGALNRMLNLQYERGILNWLGVGVKLQYNNYYTTEDSVTHATPSVTAMDGTIILNAHFLRRKRVDLLAGFDIGYSAINWEARDQFISSATGGGLTYDFHFQPRFYFGNHIGMFFNLAYVNYNYQDIDFKNTFTNISDVLDLTGGGVNVGIGLQAKF